MHGRGRARQCAAKILFHFQHLLCGTTSRQRTPDTTQPRASTLTLNLKSERSSAPHETQRTVMNVSERLRRPSGPVSCLSLGRSVTHMNTRATMCISVVQAHVLRRVVGGHGQGSDLRHLLIRQRPVEDAEVRRHVRRLGRCGRHCQSELNNPSEHCLRR